MNKSVLMSVAVAGALLAAMVLAAPEGVSSSAADGGAPNRAAAYQLAVAG